MRVTPSESAWFKTGDIGSIDPAGFISIAGRMNHILVTSFGRNVSPEWPESILLESPLIAQAAVFGEARPFLIAILVASADDVSDAALEAAVARANSELPDYARIGAWLRARTPFTAANGLATPNGRIRRDALFTQCAAALDQIYVTEGAKV
jgi:acyl-CoA synthetase (AMP-forming)/AMP-acid ligase II